MVMQHFSISQSIASHIARVENASKAHIKPPTDSSKALVDPLCLTLDDEGEGRCVLVVEFPANANVVVAEAFVALTPLPFKCS